MKKSKDTPFKLRTFSRLILIASAICLGSGASAKAGEVVTDDTVKKALGDTVAFRKSHSVMRDNQSRLHSLLNAFLMGDLSSIKVLASEVSASLAKATAFLPEDAPQTEGWQAIAEVSNQAKEIEASVNEEDYARAYNYYAKLTFQCIKCHQAYRSWGKFPDKPKPQETEASGRPILFSRILKGESDKTPKTDKP